MPRDNDPGVRVSWTLVDKLEVRDRVSGLLLLRCSFREHWDSLPREDKAKLLKAIAELAPSV